MKSTFADLRIELFSEAELKRRTVEDFDMVGIIGDPSRSQLRTLVRAKETTLIAFQPQDRLSYAKELLPGVDSVVLCDLADGDPLSSVTTVVYHFLESLVIPSLLNIDLADVHSIAKGIGLSIHISGKDSDEIISKLPRSSYLARSALLHFSCADDVSLKEIYDVSKALMIKREKSREIDLQPEFDSRTYRRVNVKIGLRVMEDQVEPYRRISLTAMMFGI